MFANIPLASTATILSPSISQSLFIGQGAAAQCFNHGTSFPCNFASNRNYFFEANGALIQNASTTLTLTGPLSGSSPTGNWSFQMNTYAPSGLKDQMAIMQFVMLYSSGVMTFQNYYVLSNDGNPFIDDSSARISNNVFTTGTSMTIQLMTNSTGNIIGESYQVKLANGTVVANITLMNQFGFIINGYLGSWQTYAAPMIGWEDILVGYSLNTATFTQAAGSFSYSAPAPISSTNTFPSQLPYVAEQGIGSIEHSNIGYSAPSDQRVVNPLAPIGLNSTTTTQVKSYNPAKTPGFFGQDRGPFTSLTALNGFTWNKTTSDSLTIGIPSINGLVQTNTAILYNSSLTSWQFPGVNLFFKPQGYQVKIQIQGNVAVPTTILLPLSSSSSPSICNTPTCTAARFGNEIFDWSDLSAFTPSYNNLTHTLTFVVNGAFNVDPLAIDGSGLCNSGVASTCSASLTTTNANDVIICQTTGFGGAGVDATSVCTATGLTFTNEAKLQSPDTTVVDREDIAIASSALSGTSITCTTTNRISCIVFGISGANTGTPHDPNAAVPCTGSANTGTAASCSISTSNANDIIIGLLAAHAPGSCTLGTGFSNVAHSCADGNGSPYAEDDIVSSTQSGLSVAFTLGASTQWVMIGDAIQALATVTQSIAITVLPSGAPSATIGISGCAVSNSTFTATTSGFTHTYLSVTASCTITLTTPTDGTHTRFRFNVSPHPSAGTSITFTTCGSGVCSKYSNNTYYQLNNNMSATPQTPTTWDAQYSWQRTDTFLGSSKTTNCNPNLSSGGGVQTCSAGVKIWSDYNTQSCLVTPIGNTWKAVAPNCFTHTTANNVDNVNYIQSSGGDPPNYLWLFLIPAALAFLLVARRRI